MAKGNGKFAAPKRAPKTKVKGVDDGKQKRMGPVGNAKGQMPRKGKANLLGC